MKHIKIATIAVGALAAPMLALGIGSGTASAAPGISFSSNGSDPVGVGDTTKTGAQASSTKGNNALAVSVFGPASATANGEGNNVVAIGSTASTAVGTKANNVLGLGGGTTEVKGNSNGNTIVNVGGVAVSSGQKDAAGVFSANVCGTQFAGQGSHVTVSKGVC